MQLLVHSSYRHQILNTNEYVKAQMPVASLRTFEVLSAQLLSCLAVSRNTTKPI